ncbi:hypothetical protein WJX77_004111 [Trebouxia sp. C0004]
MHFLGLAGQQVDCSLTLPQHIVTGVEKSANSDAQQIMPKNRVFCLFHDLTAKQGGIDVADVLNLKVPLGRSAPLMDGARPVVYLVNNTLHYADEKMATREGRGMFSAGFSVYFMPVIKRLLDEMQLPDMPIGFNSDDVPIRDEDVRGGPYFGYCNVPKLTSNLPLPDLWGVDPLTCGKDCTPFSETDHRKDQAVFLGRPTGWHKGTRRAVIAAGKKHPEYIVSGLTEYPDPGIVSDADQLSFGITPSLPLSHQIRDYKYIINVDGWCGSKRMKQLLASDSAILNLVSWEEEWYTPLLVPGKHYIPVRFEAHDQFLDNGTELIDRLLWAQEHPEEIAKIVQHAKSFYSFYLSQRGEQCFAVQLLEEYSRLLLDPWRLQTLAKVIRHDKNQMECASLHFPPHHKQWLHSHCKYQGDYATLVTRILSRYPGDINVADVLNLKVPPGTSAPVAGGARPVVYLVNNTLHYADNRMAISEGKGMFSAGFSTYFMPVIKRYSLAQHY